MPSIVVILHTVGVSFLTVIHVDPDFFFDASRAVLASKSILHACSSIPRLTTVHYSLLPLKKVCYLLQVSAIGTNTALIGASLFGPSPFLLPIMDARSRSLFSCMLLFVALAMFCFAGSADAVPMEASQVSALLAVADAMPFLKPYWTLSDLENACNTDTSPTGVVCNSTGFPTRITISESMATNPSPCPLAEDFALLPALKHINIHYQVNGTLPLAWKNLANLEQLWLTNTQLTGGFPDDWEQLTRLTSLIIEFNVTNDVWILPPAWLTNLTSISLKNMQWTEFVSTPAMTWNTEMFSLHNVQIRTGRFPTDFGLNTKLRDFSIYNTSSNFPVSGFGENSSLPSDLSGMTSLLGFTLSSIRLGGPMFTVLPPQLNYLTLRALPALNGTLPQALFSSSPLWEVTMEYLPLLSGDLPGSSKPTHNRLSKLTLNHLGLSGTIVPSFPSMTHLHTMTITNIPGLTGGMPSPDGSLPCALQTVTISGITSLGGPVPSGYTSFCRFITTLILDNNGFTGSLPASLAPNANNALLTRLSISDNPTSGAIPEMHMSSGSPMGLSLSFYNAGLTGSIPLSLLNSPHYGFGTLLLYGNSLDLCANANETDQMTFVTQGLVSYGIPTCNLQFQNPIECGCPDSWPAACFSNRPMASNCSGIPPSYTLTPIEPISPVEPISPIVPTAPSTETPDTPDSPQTFGSPRTLTNDTNPPFIPQPIIRLPSFYPNPTGDASQLSAFMVLLLASLLLSLVL